MTVIAFDGQTLAADKRATTADLARTVTKIWRRHRELLAISGDASVGGEMREWYINGAVPSDFPAKARDDVATLAVIAPKEYIRVYCTSHVPILYEDREFAIGSGRDYALAAMHLGRSAVEAVQVACHFDVGCGNGVDVLNLGA